MTTDPYELPLSECICNVGEHGEYNPDSDKWYCSSWITMEEWLEIHGYIPSMFNHKKNPHTHTTN